MKILQDLGKIFEDLAKDLVKILQDPSRSFKIFGKILEDPGESLKILTRILKDLDEDPHKDPHEDPQRSLKILERFLLGILSDTTQQNV